MDSVRKQFEQLRRNHFENTAVFREEATQTKHELEDRKQLVQEEKAGEYKSVVEKLRVEIDSIDIMLLTAEKIERYKMYDCSGAEKQKIKEELQNLAAYYPVVRESVQETIGDE